MCKWGFPPVSCKCWEIMCVSSDVWMGIPSHELCMLWNHVCKWWYVSRGFPHVSCICPGFTCVSDDVWVGIPSCESGQDPHQTSGMWWASSIPVAWPHKQHVVSPPHLPVLQQHRPFHTVNPGTLYTSFETLPNLLIATCQGITNQAGCENPAF